MCCSQSVRVPKRSVEVNARRARGADGLEGQSTASGLCAIVRDCARLCMGRRGEKCDGRIHLANGISGIVEIVPIFAGRMPPLIWVRFVILACDAASHGMGQRRFFPFCVASRCIVRSGLRPFLRQ